MRTVETSAAAATSARTLHDTLRARQSRCLMYARSTDRLKSRRGKPRFLTHVPGHVRAAIGTKTHTARHHVLLAAANRTHTGKTSTKTTLSRPCRWTSVRPRCWTAAQPWSGDRTASRTSSSSSSRYRRRRRSR